MGAVAEKGFLPRTSSSSGEGVPQASRCRDSPSPAHPWSYLTLPGLPSPHYCHCAFKAPGHGQLCASREPWRQASIGLLIKDTETHTQGCASLPRDTRPCKTEMPQSDVNKITKQSPSTHTLWLTPLHRLLQAHQPLTKPRVIPG